MKSLIQLILSATLRVGRVVRLALKPRPLETEFIAIDEEQPIFNPGSTCFYGREVTDRDREAGCDSRSDVSFSSAI